MDHKKKSALIVEGGGMRGIFAAGILHAFGNKGFDPFDLYIGVSAGACHLASHLAGQNSRNFDITLRYSLSRQFINPWRFLKGGHLMDLDWMWEQTIKNYRLDLKQIEEKLQTQKKDYLIVATSMETGGPLYLHPDINTLEHYLKVSSSLPILYRKEMDVKGEKATDGGISDSIPVREALRRGATDITVIRSRSAGYVKKESPIVLAVFSWYFRKYPRLIEAFRQRADRYNAAVAFINNPPSGVCIAQLAPPDALEIGRTTKNEATLRKAYKAGIDYGNRFIEHSVPFGHNK
ncbi:MAG: patatin family protein [Smithella sp.]|jgi:predicted patatin/cPLA2 family phospholipase|nr:patatin family protein [Smithella sp.]